MWDLLVALPPVAWIIVIGIISVLVIILALWGKVNIRWGDKSIGFGASKRRSCRDCMILTFSKREEFEIKRSKLENSILKNQMNFAEHRLDSILFELSQDYREHLRSKRENHEDCSLPDELKDETLYEEIIKQALNNVKDEVRRSFKENGFHQLSGVEFQAYVKGKAQDLINRARSYLIHRYPSIGMIISVDERMGRLDIAKMEDICFDIYVNAKEVRVKAEIEMDALEKNFIDSIHELLDIREKNGNF